MASAPPSLNRSLERLTAHLVVALVALVVIGGATRVMEAGLACPDWPLCYGSLLPGGRMNLQVFLEWFHRLDAFVVGVALLVLGGLTVRFRASLPPWLPPACLGALLLVAFQGALGAFTVTHLLAASTVTAHLGTALGLVLLLSAIHQRLVLQRHAPAVAAAGSLLPPWWGPLALTAGLPLLGQCLLGGAMASQWAADRCFSSGEACRWLLLHRLGAWPAAIALLLLGVGALFLPPGQRPLRFLVGAACSLVLLQVVLGVLTLRLQLAVASVTVAHQLVAALLVALVGGIWARSLPLTPSSSDSTHALEMAHG